MPAACRTVLYRMPSPTIAPDVTIRRASDTQVHPNVASVQIEERANPVCPLLAAEHKGHRRGAPVCEQETRYRRQVTIEQPVVEHFNAYSVSPDGIIQEPDDQSRVRPRYGLVRCDHVRFSR